MIWNHAFEPRCRRPDACLARGAGACRPCAMAETSLRLHAEPAFAAARDERGRAHMRRLNARRQAQQS